MTKNDSNLFLRTYKAYFKKHKKPSSLAEFAKYVLKHAHQFSKITVKRAGEFILGKSKHENKSIAASVALGNPKQYPNQGIVSSTFSRMVQAPSPPLPAPTPILLPPRDDLTLTARDYIKKEPTHTPSTKLTLTPLKAESSSKLTPKLTPKHTPKHILTPAPFVPTTKPKTARREPAILFTKEGLMKKGVSLKTLKEIFIQEGLPKKDANKINSKNREDKVDEFLAFVERKQNDGAHTNTANLDSFSENDSDSDTSNAPPKITRSSGQFAKSPFLVKSSNPPEPPKTKTPRRAGTGFNFVHGSPQTAEALPESADDDDDDEEEVVYNPMEISHTVQKHAYNPPPTIEKMTISETPQTFQSHTATTATANVGSELLPILEDDEESPHPFVTPAEIGEFVEQYRGNHYGGRAPTPLQLYEETPASKQVLLETPLHPNVEQRRKPAILQRGVSTYSLSSRRQPTPLSGYQVPDTPSYETPLNPNIEKRRVYKGRQMTPLSAYQVPGSTPIHPNVEQRKQRNFRQPTPISGYSPG